MLVRLRKNGNSTTLTVPPEELARLGIHAGDYVEVTLQPVDIRPRLSADLADAADAVLSRTSVAEAFKLLAE
jgi:antitoxin component of MazEF toxin-antitoxin module